jgi:hypothetical protein
MAHQHKTEMTWSYEEIAQVLKAAEFLKSKGSTIKLNVSAFCQEIGLSRKNAYKDNEKIRLLETRLAEAEKHEKLRLVLCDLVDDYQKKEPGWTPRRQRLLDESNRISASLGLEPLSLWD